MQDELEDKHEDYCYTLHKEWYDLLSTMEVKDNRKMAAAHIKSLSPSKESHINYDIGNSVKMPRRKKARTGVLPIHKQHGKKTPKHHGSQRYYLIWKKA